MRFLEDVGIIDGIKMRDGHVYRESMVLLNPKASTESDSSRRYPKWGIIITCYSILLLGREFGNLIVAIHRVTGPPLDLHPTIRLMISSFYYISRVSGHKFKSRISPTTAFRCTTQLPPLRSRHFQTYNMAASSTELVDKLKSLNVSEPLPIYPNCYPEINPVDIYRSHISSILSEITGVDAKIIYPVLQWTQTLEKGDLVLPIPALRIKGKKPDVLGAEWAEKVVFPYH